MTLFQFFTINHPSMNEAMIGWIDEFMNEAMVNYISRYVVRW